MIQITHAISLDDAEITERFIRAGGPGGQHVNKVATAVQLRFNVRTSPNLPNDVRSRLQALAGNRINADGELVITSRAHRSQGRNRAAALARLVQLVQRATHVPKRRKPTKPSAAAKRHRLDAKRRRSDVKKTRGRVARD